MLGATKICRDGRRMNKKIMAQSKGKNLWLRPIPRRLDSRTGEELEQIDRPWFVMDASQKGIVVRNPGTHTTLSLAGDQIYGHSTDPSGRADGFLTLRCQIFEQGRKSRCEPSTWKELAMALSQTLR